MGDNGNSAENRGNGDLPLKMTTGMMGMGETLRYVDVCFTSTNFYTLFANLFKTFYSAILLRS